MISKREMANAIRFLSVDAIEKAKSGHPGMPMGMADAAVALFSNFIKIDSQNPEWINRDRFVLSAGHGSMLLYSLCYLLGFKGVSIEDIKSLRQLNSICAAHPEHGHFPGVDITTGPLGQGLASAIGMALAERMLNAKFGDIIDHYTYVIAGDGCLMEGISEEAISLAGHLKLKKLIVLWDDNSISIDGKTEISTSTNQQARFEANGWSVVKVDGNDSEQVAQAIDKARKSSKPTMIACKTIIGFGSPNKQGTEHCHGAALGEEEVKLTREKLGWEYEPFEIPEKILNAWRNIGIEKHKDYLKWQEEFEKLPLDEKTEINRLIKVQLPENYNKELRSMMSKWLQEPLKVATRKASQMVLEAINPYVLEIVGGSADLTGSNLTKTSKMKSVIADDYYGNYIHYGIREHAMAAVMNGLALHGGIIPYGGTFFVFSDYMKPAIRLAALMKLGVIYVLTHDSIGVGEDGPTHQPIEHLTMLRSIPNLNVMRPCDVIETAECWQIAIENRKTPSALILTRQNVPQIRKEIDENLCKKGGYALAQEENPDVVIMASGSEVSIALEARVNLAEKGVRAKVISMPCMEIFEKQPIGYKMAVLGKDNVLKVAIEAGIRMPWDKYLGTNGIFIGMDNFGLSAPAAVLFEKFNITADEVVKQVMEKLKN